MTQFHEKFLVSLNSKENKFIIDEKETPILFLSVSKTYLFQNTSDEPFYFTQNPKGGNNGIDSLHLDGKNPFRGIAKGNIYLVVHQDLPCFFYYGSSIHENMGGVIFLI